MRTMKLSPSVCCSPRSVCVRVRDTTLWRQFCRRLLRRREVSVSSIGENVTVRNEREFPSAGGPGAGQGVGARLPRKEDDRLMRGRGQFVADIRLAGLQDVAFVRSPLAHALIRGISIPPQHKASVFIAADLDGVKPIRAVSGLPGFKVSEQPVLATDKVRQVGELVAMCVARTRAEAEDIAASIDLQLEELPAIHDMLQARKKESA